MPTYSMPRLSIMHVAGCNSRYGFSNVYYFVRLQSGCKFYVCTILCSATIFQCLPCDRCLTFIKRVELAARWKRIARKATFFWQKQTCERGCVNTHAHMTRCSYVHPCIAHIHMHTCNNARKVLEQVCNAMQCHHCARWVSHRTARGLCQCWKSIVRVRIE